MRKLFVIIFVTCTLLSFAQGKDEAFSQRDIDIYKKQSEQMVNYLQFVFNSIGSSRSVAKEKDIIINESYSKIFLNDKVQIEDDLDEYRTVPTNKEVQAYLKDIDFFFQHAEFRFVIEDVTHQVTDEGKLFYKFQIDRHLRGKLISGDTINNHLTRFIEINFDDENQDLKIASIYTTKLNEREELQNWWNNIAGYWKNLLAPNQFVYDSLYLKDIISFTDSTYIVWSDSLVITQFDTTDFSRVDSSLLATLDSLNALLPDTASIFIPDTTVVHFIDTIAFNANIVYEELMEIVQMEELDISKDTNIIDLSPVTELTHLKKIDVSETFITDLLPLRNLSKLEDINCANTSVYSLQPLRYLSNLKTLTISNSSVYDLRPASSLLNLERFYLSYTQIYKVDPLYTLKNLKDLRLQGCDIQSIDSLQGLESLEILNVAETKIENVEALRNLQNLRILIMDRVRVRNLNPLLGLENLKNIYCDYTYVSAEVANAFMKEKPQTLVIFESEEMSQWWENMPAVWKDVFSSYHELDVNPSKEQLHDLLKLHDISIAGRKEIVNLEPLRKLIYLEKLQAQNTSVSSLEPLGNSFDLQFLDISNTPVNSIEPLKDLSKMEYLNVNRTKIKDIEPLYNMDLLEILEMEFTDVKNLSAITNIPNLDYVYADSSQVEKADYLFFKEKNDHSLIVFQTEMLTNWWADISSSWQNALIASDGVSSQHPGKEDLHRLSEIKTVRIDNKLQLRSLIPLTKLSLLEELYFSGTQISDLSPLTQNVNLKKIVCSNNPIENLSPLISLPKLSYLDISNIPIRNFEQVQHMTNLETLICPGTQIRNLKHLNYLPKLKQLDISNTSINNLNPIDGSTIELLKCFNTRLSEREVDKFREAMPDCEVVFY